MTAVSSFRALSDNAEVAANQLRAKASWDLVFDEIVLFGDAPETRLASTKTEFVIGDFPKIQKLALAASFAGGMACIINSDIVVSPYLVKVMDEVERKGAECATSRRCEFDPRNPNYDKAKVIDNGVDFFCALPEVWKLCVREIPTTYRIGHAMWDSWMLGFFNTVRPRSFYDISSRRCIFHPRHGSRKRVHGIETIKDKYTANAGFPRLRI